MVHRAIQKHGKNFVLKDGILILRPKQTESVPRVVIPVNNAANVLEALHDRSGHFSYSKTLQKVKLSFYWFDFHKDVKAWCNSCEVCLKRKNPTVLDHQPVGTLPIPDGPGRWWHMDVVGPLVKSTARNRYLLVLTGRNGRKLSPCLTRPQKHSSRTFGDGSRGYGPNGLGRETFLGIVCHSHSTKLHTTGESPHFLVFGSEARTIADVVYTTDNSKDDQTKRQDAFSKTLDHLTAIHGKVRKRMMDENAKRLKRQNKNTRFTPFEEGEKVWVYGPPARKGLSKKLLAERWRGPYVVTKKLGETLYKVSLEKGKRHTKIVNHRRLKRHYERPNHLAADRCEDSEVEGTCTASRAKVKQ